MQRKKIHLLLKIFQETLTKKEKRKVKQQMKKASIYSSSSESIFS